MYQNCMQWPQHWNSLKQSIYIHQRDTMSTWVVIQSVCKGFCVFVFCSSLRLVSKLCFVLNNTHKNTWYCIIAWLTSTPISRRYNDHWPHSQVLLPKICHNTTGIWLIHTFSANQRIITNKTVDRHFKMKTLLLNQSYPDSSSSPYLPTHLNSKHHSHHTVCLLDSVDLTHYLSILDKHLWKSWFPRLGFCGRCRNHEFTITTTNLAFCNFIDSKSLKNLLYFSWTIETYNYCIQNKWTRIRNLES